MVEMKQRRMVAKVAKIKAKNALLDATLEIRSKSEARKLTGVQVNLHFAKFKLIWGAQLTLPPGRSSMAVKLWQEALIGVFREHLRLLSEGAVRATRESDVEVVQITSELWHDEEDEEMGDTG
ncbi:uncharacterized protein SCHCODRAFT_02719905 [Schizophyllum commune H4-8]|nr:uncharacterized protein SCHCODRAFT_02719905 [Schizophyllum commune H4-8]KAI5884960.1 hypothetical protein SCHCODRAFT_02719905 [Schizophyllum commune H4-8]